MSRREIVTCDVCKTESSDAVPVAHLTDPGCLRTSELDMCRRCLIESLNADEAISAVNIYRRSPTNERS